MGSPKRVRRALQRVFILRTSYAATRRCLATSRIGKWLPKSQRLKSSERPTALTCPEGETQDEHATAKASLALLLRETTPGVGRQG